MAGYRLQWIIKKSGGASLRNITPPPTPFLKRNHKAQKPFHSQPLDWLKLQRPPTTNERSHTPLPPQSNGHKEKEKEKELCVIHWKGYKTKRGYKAKEEPKI